VSWQRRTLALLAKAYSSIPPEKAADYLGVSKEEVVPGTLIPDFSNEALSQEGWTYNSDTHLLIPGEMVLGIFSIEESDIREGNK